MMVEVVIFFQNSPKAEFLKLPSARNRYCHSLLLVLRLLLLPDDDDFCY